MISHSTRPADLKTIAVFFGALAVTAVALIALTAGPARAADQPFKLEFDQSSINMGLLGAVPFEELSGPSSIEGTVDENGIVKIPKSKFLTPVIDASAVGQSLAGIDLPVEVTAYMGIEQAATGTYDRTTGQMEIQTKAGLWVSINVQQLLGALGNLGVSLPPELSAITGLLGNNLTCGFSPMDVTFTTESTSLGTGRRFTEGLSGPGALTGEWSQLGPFAGKTKVFGLIDACSLIRDRLPSLLSRSGDGIGIDLGGLDFASLLSGLDEIDLGPSGLTITRTLDESATPAALKLNVGPRHRRLGSRRATPFRVVVANRGGSAAGGVKVCALAPESRVRGGACRALGSIAPGQAKAAQFRLGLKPGKRNRSAKVKFAVRSSVGSTGSSGVWITKSGR